MDCLFDWLSASCSHKPIFGSHALLPAGWSRLLRFLHQGRSSWRLHRSGTSPRKRDNSCYGLYRNFFFFAKKPIRLPLRKKRQDWHSSVFLTNVGLEENDQVLFSVELPHSGKRTFFFPFNFLNWMFCLQYHPLDFLLLVRKVCLIHPSTGGCAVSVPEGGRLHDSV